jgi:protein SCO1/2
MTRRALLLSPLLLAACSKKPPQKEYKMTGEVVGLNAATQTAVIKGDKIEGWMEAMTMDYPVKEKSEFDKLKVGERISATVFVNDLSFYIGRISIAGK